MGVDVDPMVPHDHVVCFSDDDVELAADIAHCLGGGLLEGDAAVMVATPAHAAAIEQRLRAQGIDLERAADEGRWTSLDARATLAAINLDGRPDRSRFFRVIGRLVDKAEAAGRRTRAFGEMVGLLLEAGDVPSAIALEGHWNELGSQSELFLWCAYSSAALEASDVVDVEAICRTHSEVVPRACQATAEAPATLADDVEASRLFLPSPSTRRAVRRFAFDTLEVWHRTDLAHGVARTATSLSPWHSPPAPHPFRVSLHRDGEGILVTVDAGGVRHVERVSGIGA